MKELKKFLILYSSSFLGLDYKKRTYYWFSYSISLYISPSQVEILTYTLNRKSQCHQVLYNISSGIMAFTVKLMEIVLVYHAMNIIMRSAAGHKTREQCQYYSIHTHTHACTRTQTHTCTKYIHWVLVSSVAAGMHWSK